MKFGEILTVTVLLGHTFAEDLVENDNLVSFAMLHNGSFNSSAIYIGRADLDRTLVVYQEDLVKIYGSVDISCETVYINLAPLLYFELLSCNVYNCVHKLIIKN